MQPECWREIERIYHLASDLEPGEREAVLREECKGDESLRREVESLLACRTKAQDLLESPALEAAAKELALANEPRPDLVGRTLLHYGIVERIGEGGMGVVYRAHDHHLNRDVAIKVLPNILATDPSRLARFEREARIVATLSHPNILGIHDLCSADGVTFAAMELLEGKSLRDCLKEKELPVRKAIDYAVQMTQGLAAAHERGVVHRDLKPENVFLTNEGRVKILDFGLAKQRHEKGPANETTTGLTRPGVLMGTVGYMSPEQVRGQDADARSDLFSLGAILYEMLSGQRAFRGDSEPDAISAILKEDPPELTRIQKRVTPAIERVVRRCLEKNPSERFQSAHDLGFALEAVCSDSRKRQKPARWNWNHPGIWAVVSAGVLLFVVATTYWITRRGAADPADLPMLPVPFTTYPGLEFAPSFSPDGNQVAFTWDGEKQDNFDIYIKQIGSESSRRLTTDAHRDFDPVWSPDGQSIAFKRDLDDRAAVMLIPANGGRERRVADFRTIQGICWHPAGKWLAVSCDPDSAEEHPAIYLLSPETGERRRLTSTANCSERHPAFSPDGRSLAFVRAMAGAGYIFVLRVSADLYPEGEPKQITFVDQMVGFPSWMPDGKEIIYSSGSKSHDWILWRVPASGSGKPKPLPFSGEGMALHATTSLKGHRLVYQVRFWDINIWRCQIPNGEEKPVPPSRLMASTRVQENARYSPDGKAVAYVAWTSGRGEIWVCDADGKNPSQLTHLGGQAPMLPRWSPDGHDIIFNSITGGQNQTNVIPAQGGEVKQMALPFSEYSRDGKWIYFVSKQSGSSQIWKRPAEGGEAVQVTRKGGFHPLESTDGKTLFYLKPTYSGFDEVWKVSENGSEERRVVEGVVKENFDVKQYGIYYASMPVQNEIAFFFYKFASGRTKRIATIRHNTVEWGFTASPDERWILYTQGSDERSDLMLVDNFR